MKQENSESRVLVMRLPTLSEMQVDLREGITPELRVEMERVGDDEERKRLRLFGGQIEAGETPARAGMRELGEEANVFQLVAPLREIGKLESVAWMFVGLVPSFDRTYLVDGDSEVIGLERMRLSELIDQWEELEWQDEVGDQLGVVASLFQMQMRELIASGKELDQIYQELLLWEAKEYLQQYRDDEIRFALNYFGVMSASGESLWERRAELLSIIEDDEARGRLEAMTNLIEDWASRGYMFWEAVKRELEDVNLWTGDIDGLGLKQRVDELVNELVRVLWSYGGVEASDVGVSNEARTDSLVRLASRVKWGGKVGFEVLRWWGLFYDEMRLRRIYEEKLNVGNDMLHRFLESYLVVTEERVDWGEVGGRPTVRKYRLDNGREVRVVWVDGGEKSFVSFVRKVLLVGQDKIDEINDNYRLSLVVLDQKLVAEFYRDFIGRLESSGFGWGSKRREVGMVRNQLSLTENERGGRGEREGSIADRFVEVKGYVWYGDSEIAEIAEMAIWGLPYASKRAKQGEIESNQLRYGYLEKVIDDEFYPFWRLLSIFAILFPDPIYNEVVGRLVKMRRGRMEA